MISQSQKPSKKASEKTGPTKTHGGERQGAGRKEKPDKKVTVSMRISQDNAAFIASLPKAKRAAWLDSAITIVRNKDVASNG